MAISAPVNISEVIDNSKVGRFQIGVFVLCALCLIMDGFDVQAVGYAGPALIRDWQITRAELGRVVGMSNLGVLIGAVFFSMLADKVGRRPVLIGATLFFSAVTFLTGFTTSLPQLLVARFIAGIGMGCILPNATALIGEYSPRSRRVTLMMNVSVAFTGGAAISGLVSTLLIPTFGWRSMFYFGGATPLVIGLLMLAWLPESLQFLALSGRSREIAKWLQRIDPLTSRGTNNVYMVDEQNRKGVPVLHLFREGRALGTVLLWIINFMNLLNLYFLSNWLATVFSDAGYSGPAALLIPTTLQVGGTLGTFGLAWFISKSDFIPVLTTCFALACISIGLIGQPGLSVAVLFVAVFVAGWCVVGGQPAVNTLAATFYPTALRSSGIGWGLGVGRIGAIIGPVLAGELLNLKWPASRLFVAAAVPALIASVVTFSFRWARIRRDESVI
jgi:AAHS family 4-hydroxybenzoate transporter-like MFS transporter